MAAAVPETHRSTTHPVDIGGVVVGGGVPVVVQSMTSTDTADVDATTTQALALAEAGSELVRITVNVDAAAVAVPEIRARLDAEGCDVPLVGDFHYNGHVLLERHPDCAQALAKLRINPGNVGRGGRRHLAAGHRRGADLPGLRRRPAVHDPSRQRGGTLGAVHPDCWGVRGKPVSAQGVTVGRVGALSLPFGVALALFMSGCRGTRVAVEEASRIDARNAALDSA